MTFGYDKGGKVVLFASAPPTLTDNNFQSALLTRDVLDILDKAFRPEFTDCRRVLTGLQKFEEIRKARKSDSQLNAQALELMGSDLLYSFLEQKCKLSKTNRLESTQQQINDFKQELGRFDIDELVEKGCRFMMDVMCSPNIRYNQTVSIPVQDSRFAEGRIKDFNPLDKTVVVFGILDTVPTFQRYTLKSLLADNPALDEGTVAAHIPEEDLSVIKSIFTAPRSADEIVQMLVQNARKRLA